MKEGNKMYDAVILRYEGSYTVDGNEVIITTEENGVVLEKIIKALYSAEIKPYMFTVGIGATSEHAIRNARKSQIQGLYNPSTEKGKQLFFRQLLEAKMLHEK